MNNTTGYDGFNPSTGIKTPQPEIDLTTPSIAIGESLFKNFSNDQILIVVQNIRNYCKERIQKAASDKLQEADYATKTAKEFNDIAEKI